MTARAAVARSDAPVLEVEELVKSFPVRRSVAATLRAPWTAELFRVLDGVSFSLGRGELVGVLGANGAGKTTLLRMIATAVLPDAGTVRVSGHDVRTAPAAVRALVSTGLAAERGLYWRLTAAENLRLWAELNAVPVSRVAERVEAGLAMAKLEAKRDVPVRTFSSGMMQRLLVARAMLSEPTLLLLDEPTRSLDPIAARDFRQFLRTQVLQNAGGGVLLATHNAEEAFHYCDRVVVIDRGRVVAQGSARQLAFDSLGVRYVLLTREAQAEAAQRVLAQRGLEGRRVVGASEGWVRLAVATTGDEAMMAAIVGELVAAGIAVASFGREEVELAELIDAVSRVAREKA